MNSLRILLTVAIFILLPFCIFSQSHPKTRWLVKFSDTEAREELSRKMSEQKLKRISTLNSGRIQVWESSSESRMGEVDIQQLQAQFPEIFIEEDHIYRLADIPNDPQFQYQQHLYNTGQNGCNIGNDIGAVPAWDMATGDTNTVIVIIDGGIDLGHEDLKDNLWTNGGESGIDDAGNNKATNGIDDDGNGYIDDVHGWNFAYENNNPEDDTYSGHGTHVSGIAAAKGNNGVGIAGVCWNCKIMPLKFTDSTGIGRTSAAIDAIEYAIDMKKRGVNVAVINNSWGGGNYSELLKKSIEHADLEEILFVAAAGNDSLNLDRVPFYPASYEVENIISVGATDCEGELASFSNFGQFSIDITAQGEAIRSTLPNNEYGTQSGTSMAAPQVAGAVALLINYYINYDYLQVKAALIQASRPDLNSIRDIPEPSQMHLYNAINDVRINQWNEHNDFEVTAFEMASNSIAWIGTKNGNVYRFNTRRGLEHSLASQEVKNSSNYNNPWELFNFSNSTLPRDEITALHVYSDQSIWVGTKESGLAHFNGFEWKIFDTLNSRLPNDKISEITSYRELGDESIYVGTMEGGLVKINPSSFQITVFDENNSSLPSNQIKAVEPSKISLNDIWLYTETGVVKLNTLTGEIETLTNPDIPIENITDIATTTEGNLLIGTIDRGLYTFSNGRYQNENSFEIYITNGPVVEEGNFSTVNKIIYALDGTIWLNTDAGLLTNDDGFTPAQEMSSQYEYYIVQFMHDDAALVGIEYNSAYERYNYKNIWVETEEGGLWHFRPNDLTLHHPNGFNPDGLKINSISIASDGNLWVGTEGTGAFKTDGKNWEGFNIHATNRAVEVERVRDIIVDLDGSVWFGNQSSLIRYDDNGWKNYHFGIGSANPWAFWWGVRQIIIDQENRIWTRNSLNQLAGFNKENEIGFLPTEIFDYVESTELHSLTLDKYKRLSGANETGVYLAIDDSLKQIFSLENLLNTYNTSEYDRFIQNLLFDHQNTAWLATPVGLIKLNQEEQTLFTPDNSPLPFENVTTLALDPDGGIWGGTEDGNLFKLKNGKWQIYNSNNAPIPELPINALAVQEDGTVWIGSTGLVAFSPPTVPSFSFDKPIICLGDEQVFISTGFEGERIEWYVEGELVGADSQMVERFAQPGSFKIELVAYEGGDTLSSVNYITVREPVQLDLGQDTTSLASAVLIAPEIPMMNSYEWTDLAGNILGTGADFSVKSSGTYKLHVEDLCGYQSSDEIMVELIGDGKYILPGDVNLNGKVDQEDFFLMGMMHGMTGPERQDISPEFIPQLGIPWTQVLTNELVDHVNYMHADADGDGEINIYKDGEIARQFLNANQPSNAEGETEVNLNLEILNQEVTLGERIDFEFWLNGDTASMNKTYGVSLSLDLNVGITEDPDLYESPSWLGTPGNNLFQTYHLDRQNQRIDLVFTRTDLSPTISEPSVEPSFGRGGTITIIDDIDTTSIRRSYLPVTFTVKDVMIVDREGKRMPVSALSQQRTHTVMVRIPPSTSLARLTNFEAICEGGKKTLSWSAWEKNIMQYEIEHSYDGESFELVEVIEGAMDTLAQKRSFLWPFESTRNGGSYRLKIIGLQGDPIYSPIISADVKCEETVSIGDKVDSESQMVKLYPNPVTDLLATNVELANATSITLNLYSLSGSLVFTQENYRQAGKHELIYELNHLPRGFYLAHVLEGDHIIKSEKVVLK